MNDRTRRPILAAAAFSTALAVSAIGGAGTALAQSEEMPPDDTVDAAAELTSGDAVDGRAATAGFTLITDEMGNTQLVRDADADPATAEYDPKGSYEEDDDGHEDDEEEDDD